VIGGWQRIVVPALLTDRFPRIRGYARDAEDGVLRVFSGPEPEGWHLSISFVTRGGLRARLPSWEEIRDARYAFCPGEVTMAMLLPPAEECVNFHETTMHLWQADGPQVADFRVRPATLS